MAVNSIRQVIKLHIALDDIVTASIVSNLKAPHISDTFLRRASQSARYRNSLCGDIAKLVVKRYIQGKGFNVVDWDDVRPNWRSTRKPFDLQVNDINIEVASSQLQQNDLPWTLQNENIIQPVRVHFKDIVIQVFYSTESFIMYIFGWTEGQLLADEQYRSIRYVGGRPRDFFLMPFSGENANPMSQLSRRLS